LAVTADARVIEGVLSSQKAGLKRFTETTHRVAGVGGGGGRSSFKLEAEQWARGQLRGAPSLCGVLMSLVRDPKDGGAYGGWREAPWSGRSGTESGPEHRARGWPWP
jgi:hypothetical protein